MFWWRADMHFLDMEKFILQTLKVKYLADLDMFRFDSERNHKNKTAPQAIKHLQAKYNLATSTALKVLWQTSTHCKSSSEVIHRRKKVD
jgi:hypothetical protein